MAAQGETNQDPPSSLSPPPPYTHTSAAHPLPPLPPRTPSSCQEDLNTPHTPVHGFPPPPKSPIQPKNSQSRFSAQAISSPPTAPHPAAYSAAIVEAKPSVKAALKQNLNKLKELQGEHLTLPDIMYNYTIKGRKIVPRQHRDGSVGVVVRPESSEGPGSSDGEGPQSGAGEARGKRDESVKEDGDVEKKQSRRSALKGERTGDREENKGKVGGRAEDLTSEGKLKEVDERAGDKLYIHEAVDVLVEVPNAALTKEPDDYFGKATAKDLQEGDARAQEGVTKKILGRKPVGKAVHF